MRLRRCHPPVAAVAVALSLAVVTVGACRGSHQGAVVPANGCAPAVNERLDPRSSIHLFSRAAEPTYLSDPPTSGPHRLGPPVRGVAVTPIPRPSQVAMLESGFVILQSRGIPAAQVAGLEGLAANLVTVAPPAGPLPSPVVATAWTWKLECGSGAPAAIATLRAFIAAHQGVGFAGNIPVTTTSS